MRFFQLTLNKGNLQMADNNNNNGMMALIVILLIVVLAGGYYYMQEKDDTVLEMNVGGESMSIEADGN